MKVQTQSQTWPEPQKFSIFKHQVSGKTPKLISQDNKFLLKQYSIREHFFYQYIQKYIWNTHLDYQICKFMPKYFGFTTLPEVPGEGENGNGSEKENGNGNVDENCQQNQVGGYDNQNYREWLAHMRNRYQRRKSKYKDYNKFIILENFISTYRKPNIFDIKIGVRDIKYTQSSQKFKLRLNGMLKTPPSRSSSPSSAIPQTIFLSKYALKQLSSFQQIKCHLAYFFSINSHINSHYIQSAMEQIKDIILAIKGMGCWKFISSSICIIYESEIQEHKDKEKGAKGKGRCQVKFIDFTRNQYFDLGDKEGEDSCHGLEWIVKMLKQINDNLEQYQGIQLAGKSLPVPEHKLKKYKNFNYKQLEERLKQDHEEKADSSKQRKQFNELYD